MIIRVIWRYGLCEYVDAFLEHSIFVSVPPSRPTIYDGQRRDRTKLVEPYNEGSDVMLICEVEGGKNEHIQ